MGQGKGASCAPLPLHVATVHRQVAVCTSTPPGICEVREMSCDGNSGAIGLALFAVCQGVTAHSVNMPFTILVFCCCSCCCCHVANSKTRARLSGWWNNEDRGGKYGRSARWEEESESLKQSLEDKSCIQLQKHPYTPNVIEWEEIYSEGLLGSVLDCFWCSVY